jgi:hypothetical protein
MQDRAAWWMRRDFNACDTTKEGPRHDTKDEDGEAKHHEQTMLTHASRTTFRIPAKTGLGHH